MRATSLSSTLTAIAIVLASSGCGGSESASSAPDASFDAARDEGAPDASFDVDEASDAAPDAIVISDALDEPFDAPTCTGDLSNINAADFHVSFTLSTTQAGDVAIAQQRATCTHGMFWDVHLVSGRISPETDDGTGRYTTFNSTKTVNDGNPHAIQVARVAQTITVTVDGAFAGSATSTSVLGNLAGLEVGTSPCVGIDGYKALIGTVTDLCVTSP